MSQAEARSQTPGPAGGVFLEATGAICSLPLSSSQGAGPPHGSYNHHSHLCLCLHTVFSGSLRMSPHPGHQGLDVGPILTQYAFPLTSVLLTSPRPYFQTASHSQVPGRRTSQTFQPIILVRPRICRLPPGIQEQPGPSSV